MKKAIRRILSSVMVAVMLLSVVPLSGLVGLDFNLDWLDFTTKSSALEATGKCGDNVTYTFDSSTGLLKISGTGAMYDCYGSPFCSNDTIKVVEIANGVTSIDDYAFSNCDSLTSVSIGNSVTSIGGNAFSDCSNLTNITIPDSVTYIGSSNYSGLYFVYRDSYAESYVIDNECKYKYVSKLPDDENIFSQQVTTTFSWSINKSEKTLTVNCSNAMVSFENEDAPWLEYKEYFNNVIISDGCTNIGTKAFWYCNKIETVVIPNSVSSFGNYAFMACDLLKNISIPEDATEIGAYTFYNCCSLNEIQIPESVTKIGKYAFYNCDGIKNIDIPNSVGTIEEYAFYDCSKLTNVVIGDGVYEIYDYAFYNCSNIKKLTIPCSVVLYYGLFGCSTFYNCTNIESITISKGYDEIMSDYRSSSYVYTPWYISRNSIKEIIIENGVYYIGNYAFNQCTGLTSIVIPDSVQAIGEYAFNGCYNLKDIILPYNVSWIGKAAFTGCKNIGTITIYNRNCEIDEEAMTFYATLSGYKGSTTEEYCTKFGYSFIELNETHEHVYDDDCDESCNICGYLRTVEHFYDNDCDDTCNNCGYMRTPIHQFGEWITEKEASCSEYGKQTRECSICHYKDEMRIDKLPHTYDDDDDMECNVCGKRRDLYGNTLSLNIIEETDDYILVSVRLESGSITNVDLKVNVCNPIIGNCVYIVTSDAFDQFAKNCRIEGYSTATAGSAQTQKFAMASQKPFDEVGSDIAIYKFKKNSATKVKSGDLKLIIETSGIDAVDELGVIIQAEGQCGEKVYYTFDKDTGLLTISGTGNMDNSQFFGQNIKKVVIENGVQNIAAESFFGCTLLTDITIPESVTEIGESAFYGCESLQNINITDKVTKIGNSAFYNCTGLTGIQIPSVTKIGNSAFYNCVGLTDITIPASVTTIGDDAFNGCSGLETVYFDGDNRIEFGTNVFEYCNKLVICCKENSFIHHYAESNGLNYKIIDENSNTFEIKNNILQAYNGNAADLFVSCASRIGFGAFENNGTLKSVELSSNVERIFNRAFADCKELEKVIIPQSVASIGDNAFEGCDKLTIWCYAGSYAEAYSISHDIPVQYISLQLSENKIELASNESAVLCASFNTELLDECDMVWTSDNPSVVTVTPDGKITAVGNGEATITATTSTGLFATCVVSVTDFTPPVQPRVNSVEVNDVSLDYKSSATLTPSINADDGAQYTVKYDTSNAKVATVDDNGKIYAKGKGSATITCTVTDSNGNEVSDTCTVKVSYAWWQWIIKIVLFGWIWY